jgi:hypothetical protein
VRNTLAFGSKISFITNKSKSFKTSGPWAKQFLLSFERTDPIIITFFKDFCSKQGTLTEEEGSIQLTYSLGWLVCFQFQKQLI